MICSLGGPNDLSDCTAYTLSKALDRNVAFRMLNSPSEDVDLYAWQKIVKFWPATELVSAQQTSSSVHNLCASSSDNLAMDSKTLYEFPESLSPNLCSERQAANFRHFHLFP